MASLEDFDKRMTEIIKTVERNTTLNLRRLALIVDRNLVFSTPVDEGRARSSWIVTLLSPATGTNEPYSEGKKLGAGETANAQGAINQAQTVIQTAQLGQSIFITNNVPYIVKLDQGSSAQAPNGMVRNSIIAGVTWLKRQKYLT